MDPSKGTIQFAADPTKCLDNLGGSTAPGNRVGLWDCLPGAVSQQVRLSALACNLQFRAELRRQRGEQWAYDTKTQTLNLNGEATHNPYHLLIFQRDL